MQRRRNILQRAADFLKGLGRKAPTPIPPVIDTPPIIERPPPQPPPPPRRPPAPPPEPEPRRPEYDDRIYYHQRHGRVLPRWKLGGGADEPSVEGVKDLLNKGGRRSVYSITVTGVYHDEYPGHEGERTITLSYKIGANTAFQSMAGNRTARGWLNDMLSYRGVEWDEIDSIDLIDN